MWCTMIAGLLTWSISTLWVIVKYLFLLLVLVVCLFNVLCSGFACWRWWFHSTVILWLYVPALSEWDCLWLSAIYCWYYYSIRRSFFFVIKIFFKDLLGVFYGWEDKRAFLKLITSQQTVKCYNIIFEIFCFYRFFKVFVYVTKVLNQIEDLAEVRSCQIFISLKGVRVEVVDGNLSYRYFWDHVISIFFLSTFDTSTFIFYKISQILLS
jgi:hypothetical protein